MKSYTVNDQQDDEPKRWRWKRWLLLLLLLLLSYLTYSWVLGSYRFNKVLALQEQMNQPELTSEQRGKLFQDYRLAMNKLTPAQRDLLNQDRQKKQEADIDRYLAMNKADQKRYLDERINQMQKRFNQPRPAGQSNGIPGNQVQGKSNTQPVSFQPGKGKSPDQIESMKKKMLEHSTPDFRAKMDRFRKDMEQRMKERGITMPTGGRGPR
jgi:hypothetical protein